jgi:hypothetical protein
MIIASLEEKKVYNIDQRWLSSEPLTDRTYWIRRFEEPEGLRGKS